MGAHSVPANADGYRLRLLPGTHTGIPNYWESRYGTLEHPILLVAEGPSGSVILPDPNIFDCSHLYFVGIRFNKTTGGGDGFHLERCRYVLLRDCVIAANRLGREGIKANLCQHIYIEDSETFDGGCVDADIIAGNYINVFMPEFVDDDTGDFRPVSGGNLFPAAGVAIPGFPGGDRPSPPLAPAGLLDNQVPRDRAGDERALENQLPGAYGALSGNNKSWDAGYAPLGNDWRRSSWFGDYVLLGGGWIYHNRHGFWYAFPASTPDSIYFWTIDMGWLWTSSSTYTYLCRFDPPGWLWYLPDSTGPRWLLNTVTGLWEPW